MKTNLLAFNSLSPGGDLNAYVQTVSGFPILTAEEEKALAERFYYENDLDAAASWCCGICASSCISRAATKAMAFAWRPDPGRQRRPDEGGQALRPGMGVRLVSFAVHWIRAEMHEFILRNWRIVKSRDDEGAAQAVLQPAQDEEAPGLDESREVQAVARDLGVPVADVSRWNRACRRTTWRSTANRRRRRCKDSAVAISRSVRRRPGRRRRPTREHLRVERQPGQAMRSLDARWRDILESRWLTRRERRRCRNWPRDTACRPSASARSKRTR